MKANLSELVRNKLAELGLTEREFAKKAGTSQGTVNRVSQGTGPVPLDQVDSWVDALKLQDQREKLAFISLCRQAKVQAKRDAAILITEYADLVHELSEQELETRAGILEQIDRLAYAENTLPIEHRGALATIRSALQALVTDADHSRDDRVVPQHRCLNLEEAQPWKGKPDCDEIDVQIGHLSMDPPPGSENAELIYSFDICDSQFRVVDDDVILAPNLAKAEQRLKRHLIGLTKKGAPSGWYFARISRSTAHGVGSTRHRIIEAPSGTMIRGTLRGPR
jgi:hypothetical protein